MPFGCLGQIFAKKKPVVVPVKIPSITPASFSTTDTVANGTTVAKFSAVNLSGVPTWTLVDGGPDGAFTLNSSTGILTKTGTILTATQNITVKLSVSGQPDVTKVVAITAAITPSSTINNIVVPDISGVPREGETLWIGAGDWSPVANKYRYKLFRDGVLVTGFPVIQTGEGLSYDTVTADVGHVLSATVEASADNGVNWSTPVTCELSFAFLSDVITPATIPTGTLTRTTASGVTPMGMTLSGLTLYSSYLILITIKDSTGIIKYEGSMGLSEASLVTPFNIDLTGNTDPQPAPLPPSLAATDTIEIRVASADYAINVGGVVSGVMILTPTDLTGHRYARFRVNKGTNGAGWSWVLSEMVMAATPGGVNLAVGKTYQYLPTGVNGNTGTFAGDNLWNGNLVDQAGFSDFNDTVTDIDVVVDFGLPVDLHQLKITASPTYPAAPSNFTLCTSDNGTTWSSPLVSQTGLTWTTNETKTFNF